MRRILLVAASATLITVSGEALAAANCSALLEQQDCACAVAIDRTTPGPLAELSNIQGDVLVSGTEGYTPIATVIPLNVGDSVIVPQDASAELSAGEACKRTLQPETSLVIREIDGCACLAQVEATLDPETTGQIGETAGIAAFLAAGGTVTYFALNPPVSP